MVGALLFNMLSYRIACGRSVDHDVVPGAHMDGPDSGPFPNAFGRCPIVILLGDFLQLPPVPPTASLLAPPTRQGYGHQQGVALLASVPYVIDFVEMKRFEDEKQLQLLKNMRVPRGRPVPEETWRAILAT